MSLWDIHRSQTPLLTLLAPDVSRDVVNSLLTMYQQGGHMPRWPLGASQTCDVACGRRRQPLTVIVGVGSPSVFVHSANVYTGCMVASHGIEVVTDAVMKGVQGINTTLAFEASYAASNGQDRTLALGDTLVVVYRVADLCVGDLAVVGCLQSKSSIRNTGVCWPCPT